MPQTLNADWHSTLSASETAFLARSWSPELPLFSVQNRYSVSCTPGKSVSAVVFMHHDSALWAVFSATGRLLDYGEEDTVDEAQCTATEIKYAWRHRCVANCLSCKGSCPKAIWSTAHIEHSHSRI